MDHSFAFAFVILFTVAGCFGGLLAREPGPDDILDKMRYWLGVRYNQESVAYGTNVLSKMILCIYCNTVWIGVAFAILYYLLGTTFLWLCLPLSISALAIIVDKYS